MAKIVMRTETACCESIFQAGISNEDGNSELPDGKRFIKKKILPDTPIQQGGSMAVNGKRMSYHKHFKMSVLNVVSLQIV